jgi:uncharacterized membrane protein
MNSCRFEDWVAMLCPGLTACALSQPSRASIGTSFDVLAGAGREEAAGVAICGECEVVGASTEPGFPIVALVDYRW